MVCPDCSYILLPLSLKNKLGSNFDLYSCPNCGGYWLNNFAANLLTKKEIEIIAGLITKTKIVLVKNLTRLCPVCQIPLEDFRGESVPFNCQVLFCPNCHNSWFPKNQLLKFKEAQSLKLRFYKAWQIPLGSSLAILLPVIPLILISLTIPLTVNLIKQRQTQLLRAQEIINGLNVFPLDKTSVLISFKTTTAVKTEIKYGPSQMKMERLTISKDPITFHQINLTNLKPKTTYYYNLLLYQEKEIISSPLFQFQTP